MPYNRLYIQSNQYVDLDISGYYTEHNLDMTEEDDPAGIDAGTKTMGAKNHPIGRKFDTGPLNHTLVYGAEYYQTKAYNDSPPIE